jgi:hypothetical protein
MKMEQTELSEMSEHKTHTPGNHPKVRTQQVPGYLNIQKRAIALGSTEPAQRNLPVTLSHTAFRGYNRL